MSFSDGTEANSEIPPIQISAWGQHTRYMLAAYLRHVFTVTGALLAIALTIDLWPQLANVEASAHDTGFVPVLWAVVRFAGLRAPDLIIPFFPFATFLGVVWTEVLLTESRERLLVWNSGRSPAHCLMPVVLLGAIVGVTDFVMDAYLRPAFMEIQIREKLGSRGEEFARVREGAPVTWIALDRGRQGLLKARVVKSVPVTFRDLTLYRFDRDGLLTEVDTATSATPNDPDHWTLWNGKLWKTNPPSPEEGATHFTIGTAPELQTPFSQKKVALDVNRLWLANRGISVQYLPLSVVSTLAFAKGGSFRSDDFRTHLEAKYSELLLPGEMALLAACLAMLLIPYRTSTPALVWTLLAGYLAHFATKAMLLLGSNGYADAFLAGWLVPAALALAIALVMRRIEAQRRAPEWWTPVRPESARQELAENASTVNAAYS